MITLQTVNSRCFFRSLIVLMSVSLLFFGNLFPNEKLSLTAAATKPLIRQRVVEKKKLPPNTKEKTVPTNPLLDPEKIEQRLKKIGIDRLIAAYRLAEKAKGKNVQGVREVRQALDLSSHILRTQPEQFRAQLQARLISHKAPYLQDFQQLPPKQITFWALDPTFPQAGGVLQRILPKQRDMVFTLTISPNGRHVISASSDLKIYDLATGKLQRTLKGHTAAVSDAVVTPDGRTIVSLGCFTDTTARIWDFATGKIKRIIKDVDGNCVAITPDGRTIVFGKMNGTIIVYNLATGKLQRTLKGHTDCVSGVAISPNGRTLVSTGKDKTLKIWKLATGKLQRTLKGHTKWVNHIAISPDGRTIVSASRDNTLKMWDLGTGKLQRTLKGHLGGVTDVAISSNGRHIISGGGLADHTVKVWDFATGKLQRTLTGHAAPVLRVSISSDNRTVVSADLSGSVKIWDLAINKNLAIKKSQQAKQKPVPAVGAVAISPNGRTIVSTHADNTLKIWDFATGKLQRTLKGHTHWLTGLLITPDGRKILSSSADKTLRVWDLATGKTTHVFKGYDQPIARIAISPDGRTVVSLSGSQTLKVWDLPTKKLKRTSQIDSISDMVISPNGRHLISSGSSTYTEVKVWNLATGKLERTLEGEFDHWIKHIAVSPDSRTVVSAGRGEMIKVRDLGTGKLRNTFKIGGFFTSYYYLKISPDGRHLLALSSNSALRVWDLTTGKLIFTYPMTALRCCFTPDGKTLIVGAGTAHIHRFQLVNFPTAKKTAAPKKKKR